MAKKMDILEHAQRYAGVVSWESWFAWRPVKIVNRPDTYVWLNWVARRKINDSWEYIWCYPSPCGRHNG